MTTYEMLEKHINSKKRDGVMDELMKETLKLKFDVYLLANRISEVQYNNLLQMIG